MFEDTRINITSQGKPHLGVPLGSPEYTEEFVKSKVWTWSEELLKRVSVANTQPHVTFAAFSHGMF